MTTRKKVPARRSVLILASRSPRRTRILTWAKVRHEVEVPRGVIEGRRAGEGPASMVRRLALAKALAISKARAGRWVLGADTTVAVGKRILEKPAGFREARRMLRTLEGREHEVWTGVALVKDGRAISVFTDRTQVRFGRIPRSEMRDYLGSGAPYDKAGGYDIQGKAGDWIAGIRGDFFNVMGLPLSRTLRELRKRGFGG